MTNKKKILIVSQYFWPEQFRINDIANKLIQNNYEVTVLTGMPNYPFGKFFKGYSYNGPFHENHENITIKRVPIIPRGEKKGLQLILNYLSFMISASLLGPFLCRGKFDRVFMYQPSPPFGAIPAIIMKYIKKAPFYFWITDLWPETVEATGVIKTKYIIYPLQKFMNFLYKNSDKILVSSKGFKTKIEMQGVPESKVIYWPQWGEQFFRDQIFDEDKLESTSIPNGFNIMFAGNIGTSQAFETIIDAAENLKEEKRINWVILGDGLKKKWVIEEVQKRGLKDTVHLLGSKPIEDMPYYYKKADVLLVSLNESPLFSLTLPGKLQACMASGKPILASINGEAAEIVKDAKCGISCQASNSKELSSAAMEMFKLTDSELETMGRNAQNYFDKNFTSKVLLTKLENIFSS